MNKRKLFFRYIPSAVVLILAGSLISSLFLKAFTNRCDSFNQLLSKERAAEIISLGNTVLRSFRKADKASLISIIDTENINVNKLSKIINTYSPLLPKTSFEKVSIIQYKHEFAKKSHGKIKGKITSTLLYEFPQTNITLEMIYTKDKQTNKLIYFHLRQLQEMGRNINHASLKNISLLQLFMLTVWIVIPIIIAFALIRCINTDIPKRKWLWILFVAFGFVGFNFNWTTQGLVISPIAFQIFGSGWFRHGCLEPLMLNIALPIGAVWFLIKFRKKNLKKM